MNDARCLTAATALSLALAACPANADVTPEQVWDTWVETYGAMGIGFDPASRMREGNELTLTDVAIEIDAPNLAVQGTIPAIVLRDRADGTVAISVAPAYSLSIEMKEPDAETMPIEVDIAQIDLAGIASGTPDAMVFDVSVPAYSLSMNDVAMTSPQSGETGRADVVLSATDVTARYTLTDAVDAAGRILDYDATLAGMQIRADVAPPDEPDTDVTVTAAYADLILRGSGDVRAFGTNGDVAGTRAAGRLTRGIGVVRVAVVDGNGQRFDLVIDSRSGMLDGARQDGAISYAARNEGIEIAVTGDTVPLSGLTATLGAFGVAVSGPFLPTGTPEPLDLRLEVSDLSVSETLWSLIDPENRLPHDPATLALALSGEARVLTPLLGPEAAEIADPQVELHALDLDTLELDVAGASLRGTGGFTFDNSDTTTFDGLPAPDGQVTLTLEGGNALIDALLSMGLVEQGEAMGARMVLGLFATPIGPDQLESRIDVRPDGSISANGQRIR